MDAPYRGWALPARRPSGFARIGGLVFVLMIGAGFWTALVWFSRAILDSLH
jgi:hypothetical protein